MVVWTKQKLGNLIDVNVDTIKKDYPYSTLDIF